MGDKFENIKRSIEDSDVFRVEGADEWFSAEKAVSLLLLNDVLYLSHTFFGEEKARGHDDIRLLVNCSDVFMWGSTDYQELPFSELEALYRLWRKEPRWGSAVWCMILRREMPQKPVEDAIRDEGYWNFDVLREEHGLRANRYDGTSEACRRREHEVYSAWEIRRGRRPAAFDDVRWWDGWQEYTEEHPDWYDEAWQAEEKRLCDAWLREHDYDPASEWR